MLPFSEMRRQEVHRTFMFFSLSRHVIFLRLLFPTEDQIVRDEFTIGISVLLISDKRSHDRQYLQTFYCICT
jgi:hypothetical protein